MAISDFYTVRAVVTLASTTVTPLISLISPATKRSWLTGIRVEIGQTAAVAGNDVVFQVSRPNATNTATGLATVAGHDFSAPNSLSSYALTWSTAPVLSTAAGGILTDHTLPQTSGSMWEEFPPTGSEWGVPAIATGAANSGLHLFATATVATSTPLIVDLIFSE
jgi:hypothetical protein